MRYQSTRPFVTWSIVACIANVCILGCGDSGSAKNADASRSSSITTSEATDNLETPRAEPPALANGTTLSEVVPPITQAAEVSSQAEGMPASENVAVPPLVTPSVAIAPQVPAPTEAQLKRWKQVEFAPLHLLARHQSKEIVFVSHAVNSIGGDWLVLGGEKLTLWEPLADKPVATLWDLKASEKSESVKSLVIDPTGKWIAAGDGEGTLRLWSLSDQKERGTKKVHNNDVTQLAISDDGKEIATATYGKEVSILQTKALELKTKFDVGDRGLALLFTGPGKLAVAGRALTVWDTSTGKLAKTLVEDGYSASLARSSDRAIFAFAEESKLHLLKSDDLTVVGELNGSFARNEILKLTTDGKFLWTANGSFIRGWDLASGQVVQAIDVNEPEVVGLDWIEKSKLLRVVTEDGVIHYWGTIASGLAAGLRPLHAPIEIPDGHKLPATAFELQSMVDLRSIPKPPDSTSTSGEMAMLQITSGNSVDDTKDFYRHVFGQRGWKEVPGNDATPDYLTFEKNGFKVFVSVSDSGDGKTAIYLTSLGNVDLRALPKLDLPGFKITYETDSSVSYEVDADIPTIEIDLLKKFAASGWIPYARLNSSHNEEPDSRSLSFIQNAISVRVSIQRKPDTPSTYSVQYTAFLAPSHLPFPQDCDFIECDVARSPALVVKTSLSLEDCHAFYDQAMLKLGWLTSGVSRSTDDDFRWLSYFRNQIGVQIQLQRIKEGGTWVVVGDNAKQNSWQFANVNESTKDADKPNTVGIQAADIPIFKSSDTTSVTYDKQQQRIEIKLPKNSHVEVVDFYAAKLAAVGWKEEPNGFRDEDYAFVTFTKDEVSIEVRVNSSSLGTTIGISDDGLLWDKALPEAKVAISYEGWMRKNGHPASLSMLDQYKQEMQSLLAK
jgi:WD40 repeat protein